MTANINSIPGWSRPWKTFQRDIFFPASDEALAKVVAAIKDLPADAWPTIPSAPVHAHAETPSQQKEYLQALQSWFEANLLTIPFLKYGYTTTYDDMYYAAVLDQMYSKGQKLGFLNDTMGFEYLTRAFVASAAFPGACRKSHAPCYDNNYEPMTHIISSALLRPSYF